MVQTHIPIGLVGCGRWGRHILRDLLTLGCDVTVVARSEASRQRARESGAVAIVDTPADLPAVAGIVVATPTITHADMVESLLSRGVPIFCEKPLTLDPARAWELAKQAADRLFVMDKWRYHPGVELLAQIARTQELGSVVGLRTTRGQMGSPHPDVDPVWILAPHDLGIALEIFGSLPTPRAAVADWDGQNAASLIGVLGIDPWVVLEVSGRYAEYRREVRLICREGTAILSDGYAADLRGIRGPFGPSNEGASEERRPISTEMPLLRELRAFVHHLTGGPPPRSSAAEAAGMVEAIAALRALAHVGLPATAHLR